MYFCNAECMPSAAITMSAAAVSPLVKVSLATVALLPCCHHIFRTSEITSYGFAACRFETLPLAKLCLLSAI